MSLTIRFTPLYQRILVKPIKPGEKTSGGIIMPDMALDNTPYVRAEVIAVGHGRPTMSGELRPLIVKEGDLVVFVRTSETRHSQIVFPLPSGEESLVILEEHVLGVLDEMPVATGILAADGKELVVQGQAS